MLELAAQDFQRGTLKNIYSSFEVYSYNGGFDILLDICEKSLSIYTSLTEKFGTPMVNRNDQSKV